MTMKVTQPRACHVLTTSEGCDYPSYTHGPDGTLRHGEEVAQAAVVPHSGLWAHHPALSHKGILWAQLRPHVHCMRCKPHGVDEGHGGHRHTWMSCHLQVWGRDTQGHTNSRKAWGRGCAQGAPGCTKGCDPGKGTTVTHSRIPGAHGTTTLDSQFPN